MSTRASTGRRQRILAATLAGIALALLLGTVGLSWSMVQQTSDLGGEVQTTEAIIGGNVRTLTQAQRELLRLDVLLSQPILDARQVRLERALVDQRVQEASVSYQRQTPGSHRLLARARDLARRWRTQVRPLVQQALASGYAGSTADRRARALTESLERGYNQLVTDSEINRKAQAKRANHETELMLDRAHRLLGGLVVTFVTVLLSLVLGGVAYSRFHRQRESASRELEKLNQELLRYSHVVRSTDNVVVVADERGHVQWVNDAFERVTGLPHAEVSDVGARGLLLDAGADPRTVERLRRELQDESRRFNDDLLLTLPDGRELCLYVDASPVHDDRGQLTGFVLVGSDVTERRHAEQLVVAAKESAEEIAREKATFLASMSHEIRTPLNAVLGLTDLLLLTDLDPDQREYVRTAHSSGRLLLALVNDILDFSALETGRIELEERTFELREMFRDTLGMFTAEAGRKGVRLRLDLAPDLPTHVRGAETRLRQILVNLLGNGLKFTEHGEVALSVGLASTPGSSTATDDTVRLRVEISDTGIGIPAERMPRLFQPFTQVDPSTTRKYGGTGLGLAICRLLTEQMGGDIDVFSQVGEGSVFVLEVVLSRASAEDVSGSRPTASIPLADPSALRVILAEDDKVNQTVAVHMLRRLGVDPTVVGDGRAAVAAVVHGDFDLVLMDIHMPTMDGVQATRQIRATLSPDRQPIIVAMTANALEGDRERLLAGGMDGYVSKPFTLADLAGTLALAERRPAVIDDIAFAERTGIADRTILVALVEGLVDTVAQHVIRLEPLVATADAVEVVGVADEITMSAESCEAPLLVDAAGALLRAARTGDREAMGTGLDDVRRALDDVRAWLAEQPSLSATPA
jgi:PAS domain S-box-containing protein